MTDSPTLSLAAFCAQAYAEAYADHGDLGLGQPPYVSRLTEIATHYLPPPAMALAPADSLSRLHTADLYLAMACGQRGETAWRRFAQLYQRYLHDVTRRVCPSRRVADELADSAMGHVYLPDASGRSRIASFDGRSSLGFWLTVIVKRLAIRERQRRGAQAEGLCEHADVADWRSVERLETHVRRARYQALIRECLARMAGDLSPRELLILQLHYLRGLKASEIAGLLELHRSSITRQLERTHDKLRAVILTRLLVQNSLSPAAVEECVAEMLADPEYATLAAAALE